MSRTRSISLLLVLLTIIMFATGAQAGQAPVKALYPDCDSGGPGATYCRAPEGCDVTCGSGTYACCMGFGGESRCTCEIQY